MGFPVGAVVSGIGGLMGGKAGDKGAEAMAAAYQRAMNLSPYSQSTKGQRKELYNTQYGIATGADSDAFRQNSMDYARSQQLRGQDDFAEALARQHIGRFTGGAGRGTASGESGRSGATKKIAVEGAMRNDQMYGNVALQAQQMAYQRQLAQLQQAMGGASNFAGQMAQGAGIMGQAASAQAGAGMWGGIGSLGNVITTHENAYAMDKLYRDIYGV